MALKDFKVKSDAQMLGNITVDGYLAGPSNFVIDPAGVGDDTGTVEIKGSLQVNGTTTTVNSTTLDVADLNITVAKGAATAGAADGAGLTVDGASATFTYASTGDKWVINKDLDVNTIVASSGSITIDAQGVDQDIVFRGNNNGVQANYLTIDMSEQGRVNAAGGVTSSGFIEITQGDLVLDPSLAGGDIRFQHDGAVQYFGADEEIQLTHVHDVGLLLTETGGGQTTLQFVDANESVSSDGTNLILTSGGTAFKIPTSDGTVGQVLTTDSNGALSFNTITGAYDLAGGVLTIDADGDTTIDASVDDKLNLSVGALGDISFNYGGNGAETYKFEMSGATFSTTPGSTWPKLYFKRNYSTTTPAAGDKLAQIHARGEDDVGNAMTYARMTFEAEAIGNGSERGSMALDLFRNNQLVQFYKADATSGIEQNIFNYDVKLDTDVNLVFEGATDNTNETTLTVVDPTSDRTITLPDATGTVIIQDSNNDVTIQADTTTSGVDPTLVLYKNDTGTVTDTDAVAAISFKGTNASSGTHVYGWIQSKIENATAGSEEAHLRLSVAGSNASFQNQAYSQGNGLIIYNDRIEALQNIVATGNVTGEQVISTIATGTAPLTVTSTTVVSNLNADQLDGKHASDILLEATALAIALG